MDERLRELERKYVESSTEENASALLNARFRSGEPSMEFLFRLLVRILIGKEPTAVDLLKFLDQRYPEPEYADIGLFAVYGQVAGNSNLAINLHERLSNIENQL